MKMILIIFGTRPEAIKMAPVVHALAECNEFEVKVAVTGQHREMLDQVLQLFEVTPDYDLDIMKRGQDLSDITSRILLGLKPVLQELTPDLVLVHGDTATCFASSLAAFYHKIPIGHIEAGLRTGDIYSPWPEEANRCLTARLSTLHFSPTVKNADSLRHEGISNENIFVTGNTVIDALHIITEKIQSSVQLKNEIKSNLLGSGLSLDVDSNQYVLITGHRRENFGLGFENICNAISQLAHKNPHIHFIYPVHLNPNVLEPARRLLGNIANVHLIDPLNYESFVYLMKASYLVLTDSGGVQEEAPGMGKPVLVMRETTERPEAVEAGTVKLVGTNVVDIVLNVQNLLDDQALYSSMSQASNPYGDGKASQRITDTIRQFFDN
ncbi:UDP-N-acetylglucosamine 2-epimerase (non-hydrolyzing) [Aliidiomarina sedimenti]|uniref:UDP-N-acetylglucosamine 2-epimerase (non-hydrolyzing) n=1 Tax=Aliidiomarina sedimenti TaxID=1933879 RepID=A0ABY0BZM5_9GAMM|nr:UDP-N-acetylglucosamine 2-epimerase (non-hydrolyzing) [Aliidiomarina sedimenti]RUO30013.1 UDP-N-acetylglucosamine 2-epimerase (non-hydrolyzing) [Aliidiomarina sedimenti]